MLGGGLDMARHIDVPKGGIEVPVEVKAAWGAGAYVTAMLYRPMDETARRMPGRALGIKWLGLDQGPSTLKVGLETPAKVKSAAMLSIPVRLEGLAAGEEARITVAAVDVGILNLTRFKDPAPESWFHAQRKLGVDIRDGFQLAMKLNGGKVGGPLASPVIWAKPLIDSASVPKPAATPTPAAVPTQTVDQLKRLEQELRERDEKRSALLADRTTLDAELVRLREEVAAAKKAK